MKWITSFFVLLQTLVFAEDVLPVAVIGSGPAGLSAALVTGRERVETHVFLGDRPGGPVNAITCLGNWPGSVKGKGYVVMERLFDQLKRFDVHLHSEEITQVDFSSSPHRLYTSSGKEYTAKTVIIATGAYPRPLGLPKEDECQDIETYVYKPDAARFEGKTVAIVGGGTDAVKKARILSKTASKVYLLVRSSFLQKPFMAEKLQKKGNIEIVYNVSVQNLITQRLSANSFHQEWDQSFCLGSPSSTYTSSSELVPVSKRASKAKIFAPSGKSSLQTVSHEKKLTHIHLSNG
ncbi:MAG: Glucosaminate ammonia-lyase, partial [Chlamydiae bacterium]|nr:Glucosaminate ammonia-lyase [Chlamydiota bacterium]